MDLKKILQIKTNKFDKSITEFETKDSVYDMSNRVYDISGKSPTLLSNKSDYNITTNYPNITWRKLTPTECERLQTVPDGYTEGVSNTQRYKMLGNGWTVDVIAYIFKNIPEGI